MDGIRDTKDLSRHFFEQSQQILLRSALIRDSLWQVLELLEDEIGLQRPGFYLPMLQGRKSFAFSRGLFTWLETKARQPAESPAEHPEFQTFELLEVAPGCLFACDRLSATEPVLKTILELMPFFLQFALRINESTIMTRSGKALLALHRLCHRLETPADLLEEFENHLLDQNAFFYHATQEIFVASKSTQKLLDLHKKAILPPLKEAQESRNLLIREEFHSDIKSMGLYPVFLEDDLEGFLGCFSTHDSSFQHLNLLLLRDFVLDPYLAGALRPSIKP